MKKIKRMIPRNIDPSEFLLLCIADLQKNWHKIEPLLPIKINKSEIGRPSMDKQKVFAAILYVAYNWIKWKSLPSVFGSSSSVHKYYLQWRNAGVFLKLLSDGILEESLALFLHPELHIKRKKTAKQIQKMEIENARLNAAESAFETYEEYMVLMAQEHGEYSEDMRIADQVAYEEIISDEIDEYMLLIAQEHGEYSEDRQIADQVAYEEIISDEIDEYIRRSSEKLE